MELVSRARGIWLASVSIGILVLGLLAFLAEELGEMRSKLDTANAELEETRRRLSAQDIQSASTDCGPAWENWQIQSGDDCEFVGPDCIQTVNYPNDYDARAHCIIEFAQDNNYAVAFESFATEKNDDYLIIGSEKYSGSTAPKPWVPAGGSTFEWLTDNRKEASGWRMCLRAPCTNVTCPVGHLEKDGGICGSTTCTEVDIEACCEPIAGCNLPVDLDTAVYEPAPSSCLADQLNVVRDCAISCAGDADLDGFSPPLMCNTTSHVFELPACKVQPTAVNWNIVGPCQPYGKGCVSTANVGGNYGNDEECVIELENHEAYRLWLTFLDTEESYDSLLIENPLPAGTYCTYYYFYLWCYYFQEIRPSDDPISGSLLKPGLSLQDPLGPYPFKSITWRSDASASGLGLIACAQASCAVMTCPEGYFLNCETTQAWCQDHACTAEKDLDACCLAETPEFFEEFNISAGEASTSAWCPYYASVRTTTTTTPFPDYVGELILETAGVGSNNPADIAEAIATALGEALQQLASVGPDAVLVSWKPLDNSKLNIGFRVENSDSDLDLLSDSDFFDALNKNNTYVSRMVMRTTLRVPVLLNPYGYRPYGSLCMDLYPCTSTANCWVDSITSQTCGSIHEVNWCLANTSIPGPGFEWWWSWFPPHLIPGYWRDWRVNAIDADFGPEAPPEVCCTCGGGTCVPGTYKFLQDTVPPLCLPCLPGTTSDMQDPTSCSACVAGRFSDEVAAPECTLCALGHYSSGEGATACEVCSMGTIANKEGASECTECEPGRYTESHITCDVCSVGRYIGDYGSTACEECPAGQYMPYTGASECLSCENGTFSAAGGRTICDVCAPGVEARADGATACSRCEPGSFKGETERSCTSCSLGTYSSGTGATTCLNCLAGEFGNITGLSECRACMPGTIANIEGHSECIKCQQGREAPGVGEIECRLCSVGSYSSEPGTAHCPACPAGMFSPAQGSTACTQCEAGRFREGVGGSECLLCELGSYAAEMGMQNCTRCDKTMPGDGEYWTTMAPPSLEQKAKGVKEWSLLRGAVNVSSCGCRPGTQPIGDVCDPCGEGLICLGMGVLSIVEGYDWDGMYSVWDCSLGKEETCPGGDPGRCVPGRDTDSIGCSLCMASMVPERDGSCSDCKDGDFLVLTFAALAALAVVVICYCIFDSPKRKRPKLSFLLIIASAGQLVTIVQHLGIVSLIRVTWTNPLLQAFDVIAAVTFFDVEVLRPSCLFIMSVVTKYGLRVGVVFFCLAAICLAHLVSQLTQHRTTWRTRWPSLWSALGTIFSTCFVSILSTMLGPYQCRLHPNDRQTVAWYPSVACWEGGDHTTMIILGSFACLVPAFFLASCIWAVQNFRKRLCRADTDFMNKWSFLFFRYTTEAYWYGPVTLIRNALVSLCPIVVSPVLQILGLEVVMLGSLWLLLWVSPWRVQKANYLDALCHMCLVLVTLLASFFVEDDDTHFISVLGLLLICAVPIVVTLFLGYGAWLLLQSVRKPYQFFLCHHKMGAGCFCRLLKMWLLRSVNRKVFIDSDDLKNLDRLFDVVAHETETLVAVNSQALLTRPWCVGEITTGHKSRIKLMPVYMSGVHPPTSDFIENFMTYVPDISCLTQFSIDLPMIQEALKWFGIANSLPLPEELHERTLDVFCRHLLAGKASNEGLTSGAVQKSPSSSSVFIICNKLDYEAAASAFLLVALFNPLVQHAQDAMAQVLAFGETLPPKVDKAMLICTNGVFTHHVIEALLTCQERGAFVLPIMNVTNFVFPSMDWMQDQSIFQNLKTDTREQAMMFVQAIFLEIAVDFQPSALSGTEATLKTKAQEIANRLLNAQHSLPSDSLIRSRGKDKSAEMRLSTEGSKGVKGAPSLPTQIPSPSVLHWTLSLPSEDTHPKHWLSEDAALGSAFCSSANIKDPCTESSRFNVEMLL